MSFFDDLPLMPKLMRAPALCLLLLALSSAGAVWGFQQQRLALNDLHADRLPSYTFAARFESGLRDMNALVNRSLGHEAMGYNAKEVGAIATELVKVSGELRMLLKRAAAAEGLKQQAVRWVDSVSVFRLEPQPA